MVRSIPTGGGPGTTRDRYGRLHIKGSAKGKIPPPVTDASLIDQLDNQSVDLDVGWRDRAFQVAPDLQQLSDQFTQAGHRLWLVGGPVRDLVAGRVPKDFDCCTDAPPDQTKEILKDTGALYTVGERYGTIGVALDNEVYEVTTLRGDVYGGNGRRPQVEYLDNIQDDLRRRDFTVNAQAIDLASGQLIDPFGGARDLADHRLRCPPRSGLGPASYDSCVETLQEDPLRILRAVRFTSTGDFQLDPELRLAMAQTAPHLDSLPAERIAGEVERILDSDHPQSLRSALAISDSCGFSDKVFGARSDKVLIQQSEYLDTGLSRRAAIAGNLLRQHQDAGHTLRGLRWPHHQVGEAVIVAQLADQMDSLDEIDLRRAVRRGSDEQMAAAGLLYRTQHGRSHPGFDDCMRNADRFRRPLPIRGNDPEIVAAGLRGPAIAAALARVEHAYLQDPTRDRDQLLAFL